MEKKAERKRIAIICQKDTLWSLYAWNNTFKIDSFSKDYEIVGFWNCDEKLANIQQKDTLKWYFKIFGSFNFIKLGVFALVFKLIAFFHSLFNNYCFSFEALCVKYKINYYTTSNPNSSEFIEWVKKNEIDILIIMVGHILKKEILETPSICTINKHAGLLPSNKGVFPYFWAKIKNEKQGITFHKVNLAIDDGDILYQEIVEDQSNTTSMIRFYFYGYKKYGVMLMQALLAIDRDRMIPEQKELIPSYHGLPELKDFTKFTQKKGKIIQLSDLFLPFNFLNK